MTDDAPKSERIGDWMQVRSGRRFYPLDPRASEVCIDDIAHALSMQCRFAGHVREFYSVADHSVRVSEEVANMGCSRLAVLAALLHDASEAYIVDVPRPLKHQPMMAAYRGAEKVIQMVIFDKYGIGAERNHPAIHHADNVLLATEARDLMGDPCDWHAMPEPLATRIVPRNSADSRDAFLARFRLLSIKQRAA